MNKILIIIIAFAAILFTACEKDPIDLTIDPIDPIEIEPEEKKENSLIKSGGKMSTMGFSINCITIAFPFDFELESGTTITVNESTEVELALSNEEDYPIDFVYPVDAIDQDGNVIAINNIEELADAFIECVPTEGWDDFEEAGFPAFQFEGLCVDIIYPLKLQSGQKTSITVTNEQEFADALVSGYYYFEFPINVKDLEGNTTLVSNEESLMNVLFDCENYNDPETDICPFDFTACYDIAYPISLIDEAGNISAVDDEDEFYTLLFSSEVIDFVYPLTFISEGGTKVIVDDENKMNELITECYDLIYFDYIPYNTYCFMFNYPIQVINEYESVVTVNNENEFYELWSTGELVDLVYPITITLVDETIITIEDQYEFNDVIYNCYDHNPVNNFPFGYNYCFTISYPVQTVGETGNTNTASSEGELYELLLTETAVDLVYPITVTVADSTILEINSLQELSDIAIECPGIDFIGNDSLCFMFDYPVQTIDLGGNINSFDNEDELLPVVYSEQFLDFVYPITIILEDGTTKVINDSIEFSYAIFDCY